MQSWLPGKIWPLLCPLGPHYKLSPDRHKPHPQGWPWVTSGGLPRGRSCLLLRGSQSAVHWEGFVSCVQIREQVTTRTTSCTMGHPSRALACYVAVQAGSATLASPQVGKEAHKPQTPGLPTRPPSPTAGLQGASGGWGVLSILLPSPLTRNAGSTPSSTTAVEAKPVNSAGCLC